MEILMQSIFFWRWNAGRQRYILQQGGGHHAYCFPVDTELISVYSATTHSLLTSNSSCTKQIYGICRYQERLYVTGLSHSFLSCHSSIDYKLPPVLPQGLMLYGCPITPSQHVNTCFKQRIIRCGFKFNFKITSTILEYICAEKYKHIKIHQPLPLQTHTRKYQKPRYFISRCILQTIQ